MKHSVLKLAVAFLPIACGIMLLADCGNDSGGGPKKTITITEENDNQGTITITEENVNQPDDMLVLIDKSKSMKGYFNSGNMVPMMDAITSIRSISKNEAHLQFIGDKKPIAGSSSAGILARTNFDKDTDMSELLRMAIKEGGDSIPVAIITDGIVSTSQGKNDLPQMETNIKRILSEKSSDLSWMIMRGVTPFDGTYYIEANRPVSYPRENIKVDERPFFIIIIGPKPQMRYIAREAEEKETDWNRRWGAEWLTFNSHDSHTDLQFYALDNTYFCGDSLMMVKEFPSEGMVTLNYRFPKCLRELVKKLKPSNAALTIAGKKIAGWKSTIIDNENEAQLDIPGSELQSEVNPGVNTLQLTFSNQSSNEWIENFNCEEDNSITGDEDTQHRTYHLSSLLSPMAQAEYDTVVTISFTFNNDKY